MSDTIRLQPYPVTTMVYELNGVTAVTRIWDGRDHLSCRLCPECNAAPAPGRGAACTVLTEESVSDEGAPLYSSLDLDLGAEEPRGLRAPLGLAR